MERSRRVDSAKIAISEIERLVRELEQFKSSSMGNSIVCTCIENEWDFRQLTLLGHVFSMGRSRMGRAHPRVVASTLACHFAFPTTAYNTFDSESHSQIGPVFASNSTNCTSGAVDVNVTEITGQRWLTASTVAGLLYLGKLGRLDVTVKMRKRKTPWIASLTS